MRTNTSTSVSAARAVASICGVLAGFGGLIHGIGEVLQGSVKPEGIIIYNNADFFSSLFLFTFALLILMVIAGFARDAGVEEA